MKDNYLGLTIELHGDIAKENVDILALGTALVNIQAMFDRSYCYYTGRKRLGPNDRKNFKIVAFHVRRGSIVFDAGLAAFTLQQSLAVTQTIDPKLIFEATSAGFKYLLRLFTQTSKNATTKVSIENSNNVHCTFIEGDNNLIVSPDAFSIAESMRPSLRRMSGLFADTSGEMRISSVDLPNRDIVLTHETAPLFKSNRVKSNVPIRVRGIVKAFSSDTFSGQFDIANGNPIPPGKYAFSLQQKDSIDTNPFIESLKGTPILVDAYVEYDIADNVSSKITRLYLSFCTD